MLRNTVFIMKSAFIVVGLSAALLSSTSVVASSLNVGYFVGTNAGSIELSYGASPAFGTRLTVGNTNVSWSGTHSGNKYDTTLQLSGKGLIWDYQPFDGHFHLSAGLINQDFGLTLKATSNKPYTLNGQTYSIGDTIKSITTTIGFDRRIAPYYGIGWSNRYSAESGFSYGLELGVMNLGSVTTSATSNCSNPIGDANFCSRLEADIKAEQKKISSDIKAMYPVITLGFGYRF